MTRPWEPIADYREGEVEALKNEDLYALARLWEEQRAELERRDTFQAFNDRLRREWCIETGLLERLYTIDRGVTRILIERGLDAALIPHRSADRDPVEIAAILRDHEESYEFLMDLIGGRSLTTSYIKELHALTTRNQRSTVGQDPQGHHHTIPLRRGEFKLNPNNPQRPDGTLHLYCPPLQVEGEMERLLSLHHQHHAAGVPPEVEAAWLHHRFTQIHPFQDGNGRLARSLASLALLRARWFPLVIRDFNGERARYLSALGAADQGDLQPLTRLFAERQKIAFIQALGIARDVTQASRVDQHIRAIREQLQARHQDQQAQWSHAHALATCLQSQLQHRMQEVGLDLETQLRPLLPHLRASVDVEPHGGRRSNYYRSQIIQTARYHNYFASWREFHAWTRLTLRLADRAELLVSFHVPGHDFRGVLAASACFYRRADSEGGSAEITDLTPLGPDIFQWTYQEAERPLTLRFHDWTEQILNEALTVWRQLL